MSTFEFCHYNPSLVQAFIGVFPQQCVFWWGMFRDIIFQRLSLLYYIYVFKM